MSAHDPGASALLRSEITGVILAGGLATRMGGIDKGLVEFEGRTLVERAIRALRPQVSDLLISANRNLERYRGYGLTVITDLVDGQCGPLAGIASAMQVARTPWILVAPCDAPFIDPDLASRLHAAAAANQGAGAVACSAPGRMEPMFALLARGLLPSLTDYLASGERKVDRWYLQHEVAPVDFSDRASMFVNLNTPADLRVASQGIASP